MLATNLTLFVIYIALFEILLTFNHVPKVK